MNSRAHLQTITIMDKNGKYTTVYRRLDPSINVSNMTSVLPPSLPTAGALALAPTVAARIDPSFTVGKNRALLRSKLTPSTASDFDKEHKSLRIKQLDPTTLAVIASAVRNKSIDRERLAPIEGMTNEEAVEYVTIVSTVSDIPTNAVFVRAVYNGLRPISEDGSHYEALDLSTDEKVAATAAELRFGLRFGELVVHAKVRSAVTFDDMFTQHKVDGQLGQALPNDIRELASRRPQDIDAFCKIMIHHPIHHAAALEHMLDSNSPLSEGAL
jgi:hypothetical protein